MVCYNQKQAPAQSLPAAAKQTKKGGQDHDKTELEMMDFSAAGSHSADSPVDQLLRRKHPDRRLAWCLQRLPL